MKITSDKIKKLEEEIRKLQKEVESEKKEIINYFKYDTEVISEVILSLISAFEGESFVKNKVKKSFFEPKSYYEIKNPKLSQYADIYFNIVWNYEENERRERITSLFNIVASHEENEKLEKSTSLLIPRKYINKSRNSLSFESDEDCSNSFYFIPSGMGEVCYIEEFIEFLYNNRIKNKEEEIDSGRLFEYLEEFLDEEKINLRRKERESYFKKLEEKKERKKYEDTCMIERRPFIKAIKYLINSNEEIPYNVEESTEISYRGSNQWTVVNAYNIVKICPLENDSGIFANIDIFKSFRGCGEAFPDEDQFCETIAMNGNEDNYINFYKFGLGI